MGDAKRTCSCAPQAVEKYMAKVSGPLLDRIDLHIEVPAVAYQDLAATRDGTDSASMREQVRRARAVQQERFGAAAPALNSRMNSRQIRRFCELDTACRSLMEAAMDSLGLSARAHDRILRMARTVADIECSDTIREAHLSEAIGYRSLDRRLWAR